MISRRTLTTVVFLTLLAVTLVSCDNPAGPGDGYVAFLVTTSGGDTDDHFDITSDTIKLSIFPNSVATLHLPEGHRSFELKDIADNCLVDGSNVVSIDVPDGDTAHVTFKVNCERTGISIGATTTGQDFPSAFQILIPTLNSVFVAPNGIQSVSRLVPGHYLVKLRTGFSNCAVVGDSIVAVDVVNRQMSNVVFNVQCVIIPRTGAIAFLDYPRIRVMNADGTNITDLTTGSGPSWSPDGKKIVYSTTTCDYYGYYCNGSLAMIDPATLQVTMLGTAQYGWEPDWSPTDDVIAYVYPPTGKVFLLNLATSARTEIPFPSSTYVYHPSWSPDGTQIVASCISNFNPQRLCIFNRDGSNLRFLDAGGNNPSEPSWSPDGRQIVFTRYPNQTTISVINADGTNFRNLGSGYSPSWSPDGRQIIFALGGTGLHVMNDDGSQLRRLTTGVHSQPSWRP